MRRLTVIAATVAFVASVWFANWLVHHYGAIRVWPTQLRAPAGVYVIGLAFLLRDTIQRLHGQTLALSAIAVGCALSALVNTTLAEASAAAFAASEITGLVIFYVLRGNNGGPPMLGLAVITAGIAAAAIDSYVFLTIAFHSLDFFSGQFVAKVMVMALAIPFVLTARKQWPTHQEIVVD